jgi:putative hydrolase of the HAD superfamily
VKIKAVFFDMGGTIETYGYTRELRLAATPGIQAILSKVGIDLNQSTLSLYEIVTAGIKEYHETSLKTHEEYPPFRVWSEFVFKDFSLDLEKLSSISEELMVYVETNFYYREMRPEIPEVLEELQRMNLKIGLISNINSVSLVPLNLKKYNISHFFNPIILSSEYHRRKPDPSIFHFAARMANVATSECLYVGDRVERDIKGAHKAGYGMAVQIEHDFKHGEDDSGPVPDAIISNMSELIDLVKNANAQTNIKDSMDIQAILFDAGDILYYRMDRGKEFIEFLKELNIDFPSNHDTEKFVLTQKAYRGEINQDQYRVAYLKLFGISEPALIERGKQILEDEDNNVHFFDGVKETILELKRRGFYLGIITDTANPVSSKLAWFESGGFGHVWDSIISSKEIGVRKPDPKIYQAALNHLNISPCQAVFVGHKKSEIVGAQSTGMRTIAFNYENGVESDFYIDAFADLLNVPIICPSSNNQGG